MEVEADFAAFDAETLSIKAVAEDDAEFAELLLGRRE